MYHKMTPFIVLICNKESVHQVFLKCKLQIMQFTQQPKTSFSILEFAKYFLTSSALQTLVPSNLCLLFYLSCVLNISNVSNVSSNLNRLNTLRPYQKLVLISNAQNLISGYIQKSCVVEISTAPQPQKKSSLLESGCVQYLRFITRYLQILSMQQINGKFNVKTISNFDHTYLLSSVTSDHLQGDF